MKIWKCLRKRRYWNGWGCNSRSILKLPAGIFIYEEYVMTVVWLGDPTAFVIKSRNNAEKYKEFFLETWKTATT